MCGSARESRRRWPEEPKTMASQPESVRQQQINKSMLATCKRGRAIKSPNLLMFVATTALVGLFALAQAGHLIVNCDPEPSPTATPSMAGNISSQAPSQLPPVAAASTTLESSSTTTTTTTAKSTSSSSPINTEASVSESSTKPHNEEYKQRPMPAESSSRANTSELKISYDIVQPVNATQSPQPPVHANQTGELEPPGQTLQNVAIGELLYRDSALSSALPPSSGSSSAGAGELAGEQPEMMATSASSLSESLADSPASLDETGQQQQPAPIIVRHGRSDQQQQQQQAYSPPATSRLSSYAPNFSLQNSRSHNRQQQVVAGGGGNSIGAVPLQFSSQLAAATTTERLAAAVLQTSTTTARPVRQGPFDPIIVCYLGSWSTYRPSLAKFTPENINPFLCTHIIYAFAGLSSKFELKPFDRYNDIEQGGYRKFTSLKEHNKQLKTLIAVGGWNEGSARFSKLVASPELRANFVASTIRFLREHHFDGLDLDWEYPGYRDGSSPDDRERYALLIKELRQGFDKDKQEHPAGQKLLLSVAVPAGQDNIDNGFDVPSISRNVDFMNVLTYDYYTAFDKTTNHHAPLTIREGQVTDANTKRLNIDWTIQYYLSLGAAPSKLVVGVPTYGRSYTLTEALADSGDITGLSSRSSDLEVAQQLGLGARADGPGEEGSATREKGYLAYYEICQKLDKDSWQRRKFASEHQGPLAYKGNQWVSYDDVESVVMKTNYVIRERLGGVMIWTLDNDDFRGTCPSSGGVDNPLITAIRDTIIKAVTGVSPVKTTTTTSTTTTTTTTTTPAPTEPAPSGGEDSNELTASPSGQQSQSELSGASSTSASSLIRSLAAGAQSSQATLTTPEPTAAFTCKDEGFFPNPKDCKKYFWCLDSGPANLGLVAHAFTCPSGLVFNQQTEGCDYAEKVGCRSKSMTSAKPARGTTTTTTSTTTQTPVALAATSTQSNRDSQSAYHLERSRMVVKKSRKSSSTTTTTTTTTTTPAPTTTTTTQSPSAISSIPVTNDINELVASMLQNPQFASVITNQLRLSKQKQQQGGNNNSNNKQSSDQADELAEPTGQGGDNGSQPAAATPTSDQDEPASGSPGNGGATTDSSYSQLDQSDASTSKQAQDLLQLLNLIQQLGGIDKITPSLMDQVQRAANASGGGGGGQQGADQLGAFQRRPQQQQSNLGLQSSDQTQGNEPFVFSYTQPASSAAGDSTGSGGQPVDSSGSDAPLAAEIMSNIAQLESLFAYNQPGRQQQQQQDQAQQSLREPSQPMGNIESQAFTLEDAKFPAMLSFQGQPQQPTIRVQVPNDNKQQRGRGQTGQQPRGRGQQQQVSQAQNNFQDQVVAPAQPRQAQRSRQQTTTTTTTSQASNYNDLINDFHLPYLEGDVRQPVGQRIKPLVPQQQQQQQLQPVASASSSSARGRQQVPAQQMAAVNTRQQQLTRPLAQPSELGPEERFATAQPVRQRRPQQQQQVLQPTRQQPAQQQQVAAVQQQQRRRPPNRERGQRVNAIDFPVSSRSMESAGDLQDTPPQRPRSLVLLTSGPPNQLAMMGDASAQASLLFNSQTGGAGDQPQQDFVSLSDRALRERLRLLESSRPRAEDATLRPTQASATTTTTLNSNTFFYQPTLASSHTGDDATATTTAAAADSTTPLTPSDTPTAGGDSSGSSAAANFMSSLEGPGATLDPQTGKLVCNRRGVFAHPNSCGQFIVCAPQSRNQRSLRPFEHHCPAEHIFHDSWGRCRPKSLQSDLNKFCQNLA